MKISHKHGAHIVDNTKYLEKPYLRSEIFQNQEIVLFFPSWK